MIRLIHFELVKMFNRPRTYISFGLVTAISLLIQLAMKHGGKEFMDFGLMALSDQFDISGKILNGYLVAFLILQSLLIHIPLMIALVAGDSLAGEAGMGTLRLVLSYPVKRSALIMAKYFSSMVYAVLLIMWLAVVALLFSVVFFGTGDLINLKSDAVVILLKDDILWRYMASYLFAVLAMSTVSSLAILLSSFANNSIGPIVSTMAVIVVMTIFSSIELPLFNIIKPYLFTTHLIGWKGFFEQMVPYPAIVKSATVLVIYTVVFILTTVIYFNRKDINS